MYSIATAITVATTFTKAKVTNVKLSWDPELGVELNKNTMFMQAVYLEYISNIVWTTWSVKWNLLGSIDEESR